MNIVEKASFLSFAAKYYTYVDMYNVLQLWTNFNLARQMVNAGDKLYMQIHRPMAHV